MHAVIVALFVVPLVAVVLSYVVPVKVGPPVSAVAGIASFGFCVALVSTASAGTEHALWSFLRLDALSEVFLLATTFLYAATAVFASGYLERPKGAAGERYSRRFWAGFNLFCAAMVAAPLMNGLASLWVAVEVTTVVSALLVAIDGTDEAIEASWKYVLIASLGLSLALFATIVMYYAGSSFFAGSYNLSYTNLLSGASHFSPGAVRLAFVLAVLGFGTKMGLVPMHTWLPDAHSEAPSPVSALLSGALLAVCFYAILRYFQVTVRAVGPGFPRALMAGFGVASLLLAALYLLSQRDMKRLFAYSSVEHMGIIAIGTSFGAPIALFGVLLHVLAHGAAKGTAFFGAGSVVRKFGTKDMDKVQGGASVLPWSATMLVAAVLALSALPPFGIFRSEFLVVEGGLSSGEDALSAVLVVLVTVAFFGLSWFTTQTMLTGAPASEAATRGAAAGEDGTLARGEVSPWIVVAMAAGLAALVLLGVHLPGDLTALLRHAASQLLPGGTSTRGVQ
ncbi:MAG: proton-conducting transporter transmembrane domain-containing protein [Acidimicrobiales bacterium]